MQSRTLSIALIVCIFLVASGCDLLFPPRTKDAAIHVNKVIMAKESLTIDTSAISKLESIDQATGTIIFNGLTGDTGILPGKILIFEDTSSTPGGLLRKVTEVKNEAGKLELATEQASLVEAFKEVDVAFSTFLKPEGVEYSEVPLLAPSGLKDMDGKAVTSEIIFDSPFANLVLYDDDNDPKTTYDQIKLSGELKQSVLLTADLNLKDGNLNKFLFKAKYKIVGSLKLKVDISLGSINIPVAALVPPMRFKPIVIGAFVFFPELRLSCDLKGFVSSGMEIGINATYGLTGGLEYSGGAWKPIFINDGPELDYIPPTPTFKSKVSLLVGPTLDLKLYGVVGASAEVKCGPVFEADSTKEPLWSLYVGIFNRETVYMKIFDLFKLDYGKTLYDVRIFLAQAKPRHRIYYNKNGSSSGTEPFDNAYYEEGESVTVLGNTGSLENSGYTFSGWNTSAAGTGTDREPGSRFAMGSSDVTLYAKWIPVPTYTVTYDGNGSTGGSVPIDGNRYASGASVTVLGNTGSLVKTGHTFSGWNTSTAGTATDLIPGLSLTMGSEDITLYAKWIPKPSIPTFVASVTQSGVYGGWIKDDQLYIASQDRGLRIYNMTDLNAIREVGGIFYANSGWNFAIDVEVYGNYAYLVHHAAGIKIVDIRNPEAPMHVSSIDGYLAYSLFLYKNALFFNMNSTSNFRIVDVSIPTKPIHLADFRKPVGGGWNYDVEVKDDIAYFAASETLVSVDVSTLSNPRLLSYQTVGTGGTGVCNQVEIVGSALYVVGTGNDIYVYSIANPAQPRLLQTITTGDSVGMDSVEASDTTLYVLSYSGTLRVYDISNPVVPVYVGQMNVGSNPVRMHVCQNYLTIAVDGKVKIYRR